MYMYEYTPLYPESPALDDRLRFRLLSILPGNFEDPITVELDVLELLPASPPTYEALSYVWGSPENQAWVKIASTSADVNQPRSRLSITRNLDLALRYLRLADCSRRMWIDAICINQNNAVERSHQVAMMGDIFKLATRVVVWLGPEDDTSSEACDLLRTLSEEIISAGTPCTVRPKPGSRITPEQIHRSNWSPFDKGESEAVYSLLCRPWFERVWIRQEIGLSSPTTIVMCGRKITPWVQMKEALLMMCLKSNSLPLEREKRFHFALRCADLLYPLATSGVKKSFSELRRYINAAQCTDNRDRLYGVLSLLRPWDRQINIIPDYDKPPREVYMDATARSIANGSLDILRYCSAGDTPSAINIPSWTLDLTLAPSCVEIENHGIHLWASVHAYPPFLLDMAGETLGIYGVFGASVSASIDIFKPETCAAANSRAANMVSNILSMLPDDFRTASYLDGNGLLEAYCVTLASNRLFHENDGPGDLLQALVGSQAVPGFYDKVQNAMSRAFACNDDPDCSDLDPERQLLWHTFSLTSGDRVLFTTAEGYVGLAPRAVAPGDQVYTVLGCTTPLLFRPLMDGRFRLIGDCYCHGLMHSEAILGPIPLDARLLTTLDDGYYRSWFVSADGEIHEKDPRMSSLLAKMAENGDLSISTEDGFESMPGKDKLEALERYCAARFQLLTTV